MVVVMRGFGDRWRVDGRGRFLRWYKPTAARVLFELIVHTARCRGRNHRATDFRYVPYVTTVFTQQSIKRSIELDAAGQPGILRNAIPRFD